MGRLTPELITGIESEYNGFTRNCFLCMRDKIMESKPQNDEDFFKYLTQLKKSIVPTETYSLYQFFSDLEKLWTTDPQQMAEFAQLLFVDEKRSIARQNLLMRKAAQQP